MIEGNQKITVEVPKDLLRRARDYTGRGITPTIRQGLELIAASHAYEELLKLKGRVKVTTSLRVLREDRI